MHEPSAAEGHTAEGEHEEGIWPTIARLFNFALLVGVLAYFLRSPIAGYLESRSRQIRSDLVEASRLRTAAESQLAERLKDLPGRSLVVHHNGDTVLITRAYDEGRVKIDRGVKAVTM